MNAKQQKFMSLFEEYSSAGILNASSAIKYITAIINLDYSCALDTWEYICAEHESKIAPDAALSELFGGDILKLFNKKGAPKTAKAVCEIAAIRKAVYQYSPSAGTGVAFDTLVDVLVANKVAYAEEIFKCLVKNERVAYGPTLKAVLERLFIEILKKNPAKKIEMPRKTSALILSYVNKIKTDERAMLEQRIRETM